MGVATTRPFHLYAYDHGAERRRKPRNPAHSVSVSGRRRGGCRRGDTNPKDTRPPGGLARCRVTIVRRATTELPPLCEEGPGVKGFVVAPGAEAWAADAHVDLSDRRVPVRTRRGPEGSISGLLQPLHLGTEVADKPVRDRSVDQLSLCGLGGRLDAGLGSEGMAHPGDARHGHSLRVVIPLTKF